LFSPEKLRPDEGGFVSVDGKKVGGYRDKDGIVYLVKTTCTHMGCGLDWNDGERSWDCPCHGSRFSYEGEVLEGPAVKPLKKME
jgi:Rieske Fe-S protein